MVSMTGFGRGESQAGGKIYQVEIKSVNHRYCDVSIKLPKQISFIEEKIREFVSRHISRGKVDIYVSVDDYGEGKKSVLIDESLAEAYINALSLLKDKYGAMGEISLELLARMPDVLKVEKAEEDQEKVWEDFKPALQMAIENFLNMRKKEGMELRKSLLEYSNAILERLNAIEARSPEVVKEYKTRLENRIKDILSQGVVDENRIAVEVAIFADRSSIDEEIVRLRSHLRQLESSCDSEQPVGRKLDFLVQEINREANTITSKSNDIQITLNCVEIKGEIEKIREQIQNIE